ncbi:g6861 [Coccomyxa viridis]|uniref:G6861 protein n=1 Tax=Coccomyxa viridis TaxID=1274662 RepID=A0ABP1FWE0_9CHLO
MASQQQQSSAHKESGCRRTVGAAPDEAQQNNGSRPSEIDSREEESFQQTRGGAGEAHVWPSMSVGGQQSSLISYGTAWHLSAAPCSSEATVDISPQYGEQEPPGGRKRPFPGACPADRADQVHAAKSEEQTFHVPHGSSGEAGRQEEEEYESALLVVPEATPAASAPAVGASGIITNSSAMPAARTCYTLLHSQSTYGAEEVPRSHEKETTDDHGRYWDDYDPPQHLPPEDLDNEE